MSGTSTAVALRCPRCGNLYDSDSNHRCGDADEEKISFGLGETLGEELVGAVLGERYAILERLSAGGMGVVYKAKHVLLDAEVAVKILLKPQDPDAQYRFLQEAQLASKIRHPNTVYISDFGLLPDGRSYIVMEFLRGPTLSEAISRGPISPLRACQIGLQIARGLQAVHDKGIIHRDLKPDNIFLIAQDGQQDFVKIVDFGIATHAAGPTINVRIDGLDPNSPEAQRALQQRHTLPGTVLGTPHYMSPEQALGDDVDPRADQYALGCILFEMLTGTVPFDDDDAAALMFKHAYRPPPRMRDRQAGLVLPEALEKIVTRTMAKKRDERFPAMRDLEQALVSEVEALGGRADPRRASSTNLAPVAPNSAPLITEVVPTQRPRKPLTFIVLGLALAVVLSGSLYGYLSYRRATQAAREHLDTSQLLALRGAAIEQLKRDLHSPDLELRQGALTALGTTYDRDLIPQIAALLDDKEASVRMRAAEVLGQLGQPSMLPRLFSLLETSTEQPVVAVAAAEALDELGDARGPLALRQALNGKNDAARLRAALYLCGHGDHEAQKVLNIAVQRGKVSEEGAVAILGRLAQAGDAAARENLITRLGSAPSRDLQLTLASLLGRIGESRGRDFLREQAHHPGPQQLRAAALLAALDEPVDAEQFRAVLGNRDAVASARLWR